MRTLARAAASSLVVLFVALAFVVSGMAVGGILATRAATSLGNTISGDELTTAIVTNQVARDIDAAYATGEQAALTTQPAVRSRLLGSLNNSLLPAVGAELFALERLHAGDPPAERADLQLFIRQWTAVRDLLSQYDVTAAPAGAFAAQLAAAYQPVSAHLDRLILKELGDASTDHARASAAAAQDIGIFVGFTVLDLVVGLLLLRYGLRRIRRSLEPGQDQAEFAHTLQLANDEDDTHRLLQRHLERSLPATAAVVLNRNNSADRLEAVTPLPPGSPLAGTLRGAEPRSCLAVRSGRAHHENGARPALLCCSVCAPVPGASLCVPLTVGGEVIGSVLLSRAAPYSEAEEQRIHDSVGQAAPVLANLRNLAVAEIRAATDSLTGLPNNRAVTDAMKRALARAAASGAPLALLLLDLDHFKQVNDQHGHEVRRPGPGRCRRDAARRAANRGLRRPPGRGGVRDPAARHRDRRCAGDRRADPRGDRGDLPAGRRRVGHGLHRGGRLHGPREYLGPAGAPGRRGPVRGQAAGLQPRRAGRAGRRGRRARSTRAAGQRLGARAE